MNPCWGDGYTFHHGQRLQEAILIQRPAWGAGCLWIFFLRTNKNSTNHVTIRVVQSLHFFQSTLLDHPKYQDSQYLDLDFSKILDFGGPLDSRWGWENQPRSDKVAKHSWAVTLLSAVSQIFSAHPLNWDGLKGLQKRSGKLLKAGSSFFNLPVPKLSRIFPPGVPEKSHILLGCWNIHEKYQEGILRVYF